MDRAINDRVSESFKKKAKRTDGHRRFLRLIIADLPRLQYANQIMEVREWFIPRNDKYGQQRTNVEIAAFWKLLKNVNGENQSNGNDWIDGRMSRVRRWFRDDGSLDESLFKKK